MVTHSKCDVLAACIVGWRPAGRGVARPFPVGGGGGAGGV